MPVAAKRYADELLKEINADREAHGKAPFDDDKNGYIYAVVMLFAENIFS